MCGLRVCNQDRKTYKTICLKKQDASMMTAMTGGLLAFKCIYVGHAGELQPKDIAGKPVDHGVFILQSPAPLLALPVFQRGAQFFGPNDAQLEKGQSPQPMRRCQ